MSSAQPITTELRRWIVEQAQAGHTPDQVLAAMRASGWEEGVALQALEETLHQHLSDVKAQRRSGELPPPNKVPEPALDGAPPTLFAHDREVKVLLTLSQPRVIVFGGLLSDEECDEMVALSTARLARSETVAATPNGSEVNAARTSDGMFFERGENALVQRLEARLAALVGWPVDHGEGLHILHHPPPPHHPPTYHY